MAESVAAPRALLALVTQRQPPEAGGSQRYSDPSLGTGNPETAVGCGGRPSSVHFPRDGCTEGHAAGRKLGAHDTRGAPHGRCWKRAQQGLVQHSTAQRASGARGTVGERGNMARRRTWDLGLFSGVGWMSWPAEAKMSWKMLTMIVSSTRTSVPPP
jgi:hypothetical protein